MLKNPTDVMKQFPVRKTKAQKQVFRDAVTNYAGTYGYSVSLEGGSLGCKNLVIGDPKAKYLLAAGDALSGILVWLEILRTFPENQRHKVCFILFDGDTGISLFQKNHRRESAHQLLILLGHVGDGTHLRFFPTKELKNNRIRLTSLYKACGYFGSRDFLVAEEKKPLLLNTNSCFPYAVTVCALRDHKKGLRYNCRTRNSVMDETNVNILRAALTTFICCDEVN